VNRKELMARLARRGPALSQDEIVRSSGKVENVETLIDLLTYRATGDLVTDPSDHWDPADSIADIERYAK
jgi:hypothetical protein